MALSILQGFPARQRRVGPPALPIQTLFLSLLYMNSSFCYEPYIRQTQPSSTARRRARWQEAASSALPSVLRTPTPWLPAPDWVFSILTSIDEPYMSDWSCSSALVIQLFTCVRMLQRLWKEPCIGGTDLASSEVGLAIASDFMTG